MYRVKLIILGLLLISISPASAWWNTDWENRREIQINNTLGSELTYYQVYIDLTANPINSTSLRIVNKSSGNVVSHWQETILLGNCTGLWFNATTIPAGVWLNETYYIYYGNAAVLSDWNGASTFLQYHGYDAGNFIDSLSVPYQNVIYESLVQYTAAVHNINFGLGMSGADKPYPDYADIKSYTPTNTFFTRTSRDSVESYQSPTPGASINTDHKIKIIITSSGAMYFLDTVQQGTEITTTMPDSNMGLYSYRTVGTGYQNWSFARKYAANPPTYILGTEETVFFIPPIPINLDYSKGFFWVNHTWDAGTGNVTDSYNVSHNRSWINDSSNTYYNSGDIGDGGYSEILIYAYNNSGFLSEEYVTQNISTPPYTPPPTPINLQYTKGEYWVNYTWDEGLDGFTNSYNISHNESWTNGSSNTYFNSGGVGRNGMSTIIVYAYNGILSEEYIIQTISTKPGIGYDQKISDSNIQSFFFPVMFFLLIMILVGGFKYVYK